MTIDYSTKAPGVYFESITGAGPIAGVGTSVAALIGQANGKPNDLEFGMTREVTNWTAYQSWFEAPPDAPPGDDAPAQPKSFTSLSYAVRGFFENGGTRAVVVPLEVAPDAPSIDGALTELSKKGEVSLVLLPGVTDQTLQEKVIGHCEALRDRFAVLDGPDGDLAKLTALDTLPATKEGFGALYWPWLRVPDAQAAGPPVTVPPSGHVAGIMARCDATVGVHKAPANETVRGVVDLVDHINDTDHGTQNDRRVNVIRVFPGRPPLLWGARTLSENVNWRFVNVRRLVCFIEDSLAQGLRWAVFEPNNPGLWKALERSITEFLSRIWEAGALFGRTAEEAFYVRIDEELNPDPVRSQGLIFIEVGLAPTRPAEHVVLRIGLWDGGARINES